MSVSQKYNTDIKMMVASPHCGSHGRIGYIQIVVKVKQIN